MLFIFFQKFFISLQSTPFCGIRPEKTEGVNFWCKIFLSLSLFFALFIFDFSFSQAAILSLDSGKQGVFHQGEYLTVGVQLDSEKECVNAIEALINFPANVLEVVDFDQSSSIISLWAQSFRFDQAAGHVTFSGGIPNGYCGEIKGVSGQGNLIGKIIFKVIGQNIGISSARLSFGVSQVLLNDGLGTPAKLTTKEAFFSLSNDPVASPLNPWQQKMERDKIPPEDFKIEIARDSATFDNQYFIVFSTVDKQTGIDYYEIKEGLWGWKKVTSPYVLKNQSLTSSIQVRAVDKAGNERVVNLVATRVSILRQIILVFVLILVGILLLLIILNKLRKKRKEINV